MCRWLYEIKVNDSKFHKWKGFYEEFASTEPSCWMTETDGIFKSNGPPHREAEDNGFVWEPESHAVASPRNGQRSNGRHGTPFSNSAGVSATGGSEIIGAS
ncbi:hypothetical protein MLD38_022921 [Melastoma candidum]|uniref:Uncharacterized protein n=2 Tax=Melastoma candidum TaxID=119954 RepID=A0ACB9QK75_9MYRT|nr:hypothetical protein MLD38_022919 [Melastoma candidum]KAI4367153.1 hypothetical protein MLD38_022921 [Melastoma candidum]